jgi:hypothetical protein
MHPLETYLLTALCSDGKPTPLTLYGKDAIKPDGTKNLGKLGPGEEMCDELVLNRLFDFTLSGVYTVSVQRPVWKAGVLTRIIHGPRNSLNYQACRKHSVFGGRDPDVV